MSATNRTAGVRHENDFYATPAWVTQMIIPKLPRDEESWTLDAGCGTGAIGHELQAAGHRVIGADNDPVIARACRFDVIDRDFVLWNPKQTIGLVVMNPPYSLALDFVCRAQAIVGPQGTVAALLRLGFLESKARAAFHRRSPADVFVLSQRPSFTGGGTDAAAYAWFVWGPGRGGRWAILGAEHGGAL